MNIIDKINSVLSEGSFGTEKYKLGKSKVINRIKMYRVIALKDIPFHKVKAGDVGGWVESEKNLSQDGDAWVDEEAQVFGGAWVGEDAKVSENARVYREAMVYGNSRVFGDAQVGGEAQVRGFAKVGGIAWVSGEVVVDDDKKILQ